MLVSDYICERTNYLLNKSQKKLTRSALELAGILVWKPHVIQKLVCRWKYLQKKIADANIYNCNANSYYNIMTRGNSLLWKKGEFEVILAASTSNKKYTVKLWRTSYYLKKEEYLRKKYQVWHYLLKWYDSNKQYINLIKKIHILSLTSAALTPRILSTG